MFELEKVVRANILALQPYRCARDDYTAGILLDANENSYGPSLPNPKEFINVGKELERYPDPRQIAVKELLMNFRNIPDTLYFYLGVGSDECIDMVIRVFAHPTKEKILITPPTYGMYSVCAQVNDVGVVKVPLMVEAGAFQLNVPKILECLKADATIKVVFLCSPGNPTGTLLNQDDIKTILECPDFDGVVFVDEAYVDFAKDPKASMARYVMEYPNLIVSQTLSKAFGLAGIRLGFSISSPAIAQIFNNTKAPYNISTPTATLAMTALKEEGLAVMRRHVASIHEQRTLLMEAMAKLPYIKAFLGTHDANFVLAQFVNKKRKPDNSIAMDVYKRLAEVDGVVVRFRGNELGCEGCLRITVGTPYENQQLLSFLNSDPILTLIT